MSALAELFSVFLGETVAETVPWPGRPRQRALALVALGMTLALLAALATTSGLVGPLLEPLLTVGVVLALTGAVLSLALAVRFAEVRGLALAGAAVNFIALGAPFVLIALVG